MDADKESELERRAVEELLKEASRAKVRAETMGPAGWMKCPLGSTNKRFLLNTLRSSALERRSTGQVATERKGDPGRRDREKQHHSKDKDCRQRKDREHRTEHTRSHSKSEKHYTSSRSAAASRDRSPHHSKRTCSRSPVRDRLTVRKSRDRTPK